MGLTLRSLFTSKKLDSTDNAQAAVRIAAQSSAFPGGAHNELEAGFIVHLNAITQPTLADYEWHRLGPSWRPYYHLVHRTGATPQEQWKNGIITDDAFERLKRGLQLPERKTLKEIVAAGPECITLFFTEETALDGATMQRCIISDQRHAVVDPGSPVVSSGGYAEKHENEGIVFRNASLPWLQANWERLRDSVAQEFAAPSLEATAELAPLPAPA